MSSVQLNGLLATLKEDLHSRKGQASLLTAEIEKLDKTVEQTNIWLALESETARLLQLSSTATWNTTKQLVESLVTRAFQVIFHDRDYKFIVKHDIKRGTSAVSFVVGENGMELDLVDELGGGISDVVALVLRIAFVSLYRPKVQPFLVLDEPLKHLAANYQPAAGRFLKQVCQELGMTMLLTTHSKELSHEADQLFRAKNIDNVCIVEEETTACDH